MTTRTWTRLLVAALAALLALGFTLLAPSALGGRATWVSTFGVSMQPMIHAGDLVIARPQASYHLGQVIAYRSATLGGTVVLHRIIAQTPQGFLTKGDHNHWTDPDQPHGADILGALWLHIPQGGHVLKLFTNPYLDAALVAVAAALGALTTAQVRRRRGAHRATRTNRSPAVTRTGWPATLHPPGTEWLIGTAVAAVALAVFAFTQPSASTTARTDQVPDSAALSYTATVTTTGVYPANQIRTGDPVFLHLTPTIETHLTDSLGLDGAPVSGSATVVAIIRAANGWSQEQALGAPQPIRTTSPNLHATLDFAALLRTAHLAEHQAGTSFGGYTVQVVYRLQATGTKDRHPVTLTTAPTFAFTVTDQQAVVQTSSTSPDPGAPLTSSHTTTVVLPATAPATVAVLHWDVPITALRGLSAALLLLALALTVWTTRAVPRERTAKDVLGPRVVHAHNIDLAGRPVVDVDTVDALVRLCDLHATVALHTSTDSHDLFLVLADQIVYRLATPSTPTPAHTSDQPHPRRAATRP